MASTDTEDLDKFLHWIESDDNNKKHAEADTADPLLSLVSTYETVPASIADSEKSFNVASKPNDNDDHREAPESEDPLVSLITKELRESPFTKGDLVKFFPEAYPATNEDADDAVCDVLNFANHPNTNQASDKPSHTLITPDELLVSAKKPIIEEAVPSPAFLGKPSGRGKRKIKCNKDESMSPPKFVKTPSKSTLWREGQHIEIDTEEKRLESLSVQDFQETKNITGQFGALAYKHGKLGDLKTFEKHYLFENFPDYFHLDKTDEKFSKELKESLEAGDKRERKAKYLKILRQSNDSREKFLDMKMNILKKLSQDIYNQQG